MVSVNKILQGQLELRDSLRNYDDVSFTKKEVKEDENGKFQIKVSYLKYKGQTEYPDNGIVGYKEEKVYLKDKIMKTKNQRYIAVVTTSRRNYENYLTANNIPPKEAKWVAVLRDVKDTEFSSVEFISGFENVTDFVISKIKVRDEEEQ